MSKDTLTSREKTRLDLLMQLGDVSRANQGASDLFDERLGAFMGTNRTDGRCLGIVERFKSISAGQLAKESGLTTGAVTAVVDRLEAAGYVRRVRDPVDRRKIWIECTELSNTITAEIFGFYDVIGPAMMKSFDIPQIEAILAFLRIGTRVNEAMASALAASAKPDGSPSQRTAQAKEFRRTLNAGAAQLAGEIEKLAARPGKKN